MMSGMTVHDAVKERRSARLFSDRAVDPQLLVRLADGARLSPSAANLQPLRYGIITDTDTRKSLYPHVRYAGYVKDWDPGFEQTPTGFIAVFCDTAVRSAAKSECDCGIAMMSISLLAHEMGLGSCILGAIDRKEICELLGVGDGLELMYLVGIGYSDGESSCYDSDTEVRYTMNDHGGFNVPKRSLERVLTFIK